MACHMMIAIAFICVALTSLSYGQTTASVTIPKPTCLLSVPNNKTFLDSLPQYFDKDSNTLILEYFLNFTNVESSFDLTNRSSPEAFQPWRWFRTQGQGSSQLLLIYNYYYGLLEPFMTLSIARTDINLEVSQTECLDEYEGREFENLIRDFLLQDFNIDSKSAKPPFIYSDKVEICTASIGANGGWGQVVYKCCGLDLDKKLYCKDVSYNTWVLLLDAFVVVLTLLLFLYIPVFIPQGYRDDTYSCESPKDLKINVVITRQAEKYNDEATAQIVQPKIWTKMPSLASKLSELQPDNVYTGHVKRADFHISMYKLFVEGCRTVQTRRYFFNAFIRCKLRNSAPLEECCRTPACGIYCCHRCPPWGSWLKAFRTIVTMAVLALPSLPFMYAISADDLYYQKLIKAYNQRGLKSHFNFYAGPYFGKALVGVIATMYVLLGFILILDRATNNKISILYADILSFDKHHSLRRRLLRAQDILKAICGPIKRCGIVILPVWIIGTLLIPVALLALFIWNSPMCRVMVKMYKKIKVRHRSLLHRPLDKVRLYSRCELLWFFLTSIVAVVVLTIGANFLVHIVAMIIVTIVVEADLIYRILPVVLLLFIYIRDSYGKVGKKFDDFLSTLISIISKSKMSNDVRKECLKSDQEQKNTMFQMTSEDVVDAPSSNVTDVVSGESHLSEPGDVLLNLPFIRDETIKKTKRMFEVKNEQLIIRLRQPFVFLSKDDFLHISKKFLFDCATIDCAGVPGTLGENYVKATVEFMKIGAFILFVFLVIMAYGSIYYISPTNQLFVTLASGLVPLIIRSVFLDVSKPESVNDSNFRFLAQLREKIDTFSQRWHLEDIDFEKLDPAFNISDTTAKSPPPKIDLVLVMDNELAGTGPRPPTNGTECSENVRTTFEDTNPLMSSNQSHDLEMVPLDSVHGATGGDHPSFEHEQLGERQSGSRTSPVDHPPMTSETESENVERAGERDANKTSGKSSRRSRKSTYREMRSNLESSNEEVTSDLPSNRSTCRLLMD